MERRCDIAGLTGLGNSIWRRLRIECGCLVVGSATELATFDTEMAARVTAAIQRIENVMWDLTRLGRADTSIASGLDSDASARMLLCLLQDLRVVGKTGRSRAARWPPPASHCDCSPELLSN